MDIAHLAAFMKAHSTRDSYHFQEEIELRKILAKTRDDCLEGFFQSLFSALQGDVHARARLVDIALRYGDHATLARAAASKIGSLTDEDKILLIPAHLFSSPNEVARAIAHQIGTIRADDPRRYFLERGLGHPDPAVRRICAESLAYRPATQLHEYVHASADFRPITETQVEVVLRAKKTKSRNATGMLAKHTNEERKKASVASNVRSKTVSRIHEDRNNELISGDTRTEKTKTKTKTPIKVTSIASVRISGKSIKSAPHLVRGNLIEQISAHINDPHPEVRLKWVMRIGEIPAQKDADDVRKMAFISIALADVIREVSFASVSQIEFLLLDKSKLAMLLKILSLSPDLAKVPQFQKVLESLPSALQEEYIGLAKKIELNQEKKVRANAGSMISSNATMLNKDDLGDARASDRQKASVSGDVVKSAKDADSRGKSKISRKDSSSQERSVAIIDDTSKEARDRNDASIHSTIVSDADRTEIQILLSELDFDGQAMADLTNEKSPTGAFFKSIAPISEAQKIDNYFLRHTAVLHIKDLHAEDVRYRLYLSVLDYDPKDIVRQIAVQEARNLESGHAQEILRRALADRAWQVRVSALDNLLYFIPDVDEKRRILTACTRDAEYHVRQKAAALLAVLTDGERGKIQLL